MGERTSLEGPVRIKCTLDSGYTTAAVGDKVKLSGDYEVAAVTAAAVVLGEIVAINKGAENVVETVTVECRGQKIDNVTLDDGAGVTAGDLVEAAGATTVAGWTTGAGLSSVIYGLALEDAADTETLDVLVL